MAVIFTIEYRVRQITYTDFGDRLETVWCAESVINERAGWRSLNYKTRAEADKALTARLADDRRCTDEHRIALVRGSDVEQRIEMNPRGTI